ncbi:hypothetical protein M5J14_06270 [Lysinibacillus sp. OL1_EC]|uniref:hypothetical protein n=1 Tax=unclassified Lysinibacillus TaxID=2636778 RepID=UPI00103DA8A4|nr:MULTISPECIES: hypothetical protein [unclassified Lysinibacillus]MCM0624128.1 hypothetical protein [Lysinibacillus sp. OL1_EC]TBV88715.1 hypothetical protein EW028_04535 [Lysinibacillus sp. OL1]WGT37223.1 hypothetical protein QH639_15365 [Lysinibacillus sp. 1 U-2021]
MDGNRYLTRMNWEFNNYHKFSKCYCESKNVYFGHSPSVEHPIIEEDSYKIKYYNSPQFEKKYQKQNQIEKHCQSCICSHLECFEPGTLVDVYLSDGSQFLGIYFIYLIPHSCCGYFLQIDDMARPVIMDCQNIDAIRKTC